MTGTNCVYFTHDWRELRAWLTGSKIVRPFKEQWITKLSFEAVKINSGNFVWHLLSESQHDLKKCLLNLFHIFQMQQWKFIYI